MLGLTVGGSLVLVIIVLVAVFAAVRRSIDRAADALKPEGIELDSGRVTLTTRLRDFRAPGIRSGRAIRRTPGRLVLTKQRLYLLCRPQRYGIIDRRELARFTVGIHDGCLHLTTNDPPDASGSIDYRLAVANPGTWVAALQAAGARPAA
jgi:hypothetical protein